MAEFKATGDAHGLHRAVEEEAAQLRQRLRETMREVAEDAELIFAAHALKGDTGKLSRGVSTVIAGDGLMIRVDAVSRTGYDYVGVTRFGHRVKWIVPRSDRGAASVLGGKKARGTVSGGNAALAFSIGGRLMFRKRVRGFKPKSDWAADALPEVRDEARERMKSFGHGITVRLSR